MACRPVVIFKTPEFWFGVVAGAIGTLIVARSLGWLVF
jgi:hypothetical protein